MGLFFAGEVQEVYSRKRCFFRLSGGEGLYETLRVSGNSCFGYVLLGSTLRFHVHGYRGHDITNQNAMQKFNVTLKQEITSTN